MPFFLCIDCALPASSHARLLSLVFCRSPPEAVGGDQSWFNAMAVIALVLTVIAVFAVKLLGSPLLCAGIIAALLAGEWLQNRRGALHSLRNAR
jgi:hypothetical protein